MDATVKDDLAAAIARLPERQRHALELREAEGLSYEEIATSLGTGPDSVAQLIARAWVNLCDEREGTVLASIAPSAECERALPLIAAREDAQLDSGSPDAAWLDAHLGDCDRCRRGAEEIREARAHHGSGGSTATPPRRRRRATVLVAAVALLLLAGVATAMRGGGGEPAAPAGRAVGIDSGSKVAAPKSGARGARSAKARPDARRAGKRSPAASPGEPGAGEAGGGETTAAPAPVPVSAGGGSGDSHSGSDPDPHRTGGAAVRPVQPASAARPTAKASPTPTPAPSPTPTPSSAPTPVAEEPPPPPVEEHPSDSSRGREPPGRPADLPKK